MDIIMKYNHSIKILHHKKYGLQILNVILFCIIRIIIFKDGTLNRQFYYIYVNSSKNVILLYCFIIHLLIHLL